VNAATGATTAAGVVVGGVGGVTLWRVAVTFRMAVLPMTVNVTVLPGVGAVASRLPAIVPDVGWVAHP
jgi:hypothetical protein